MFQRGVNLIVAAELGLRHRKGVYYEASFSRAFDRFVYNVLSGV